MPLIHIESEIPVTRPQITRLLDETREAAAAAFNCDPSQIWIVYREIPSGHSVGETAGEPVSPLVSIRAKSGRSAEARERLILSVAGTVARGLEVASEKVWIHYLEMRPEDVSFGLSVL